jgi:hypothetical protein
VDEAAFGRFDVGGCEGVGDGSEAEGCAGGIREERRYGHGDCSVPARSHGHRQEPFRCIPRRIRAEVRPCRHDRLMPARVPQRKSIVEGWCMLEVEGARCRIFAAIRIQQPESKCWCTKSVYVSYAVRTSGSRTHLPA